MHNCNIRQVGFGKYHDVTYFIVIPIVDSGSLGRHHEDLERKKEEREKRVRKRPPREIQIVGKKDIAIQF